jgi:four helix bundle protein
MNIVFPFQKLDCYVVAKDFARLAQQAAIEDAELRDQVTRAAKSVFLNTAEGLPDRRPGIRRKHFNLARNSLGEAVAGIDLSLAIGALGQSRAEELTRLAQRLAPLLGGLLKAR